ncbi:MAG: recombinase family protein [Oscillospiraceae bacterium]|nr:recombinase family protein [Oscillospiraceae bacterium]
MKNKKGIKDDRKIAIYSRKSKYTGKGESTQNQIEACKRKIALAFEDVDLENDVIIFEDEGFTGYNTNRPDYQKMIKMIKSKEIKAVAFYKLDRISRNVSDFSNLLLQLDNYDVAFLSATESIENVSPSGRAMMFMISVFAQLERDTIAERIRDNMHELAKTGRWLGGNAPTGYKSKQIEYVAIDGKKRKLFQLDDVIEEKKIVTTLFYKMLELRSQTKMETFTIQNNMKTKTGKNFSRWGLKNILTNPVYAVADQDTLDYFRKTGIEIYADEKDFDGEHGMMVYNKTEKKSNVVVKKHVTDWIVSVGKHQGFIPGKIWVEVQGILERNSDMKYRKPSTSNAVLSGILRCSHCGTFMRPKLKNKTIDEQGRKRFDYMCELKDKSKKDKCQCRNINGLEADDLVLAEIRKLVIPTSKFYQALKKLSSDAFNKDYRDNQELKTLKSLIYKNETNISLLLDRIKFVDVSLIDELSKEIKELKEANNQLGKQVKALTNNSYDEISDKETAELLLSIIDTYLTSFDTLDLNSKRTMIKLLVSSITSDGENVTLNFLGARNTKGEKIPTGTDYKRNFDVFPKPEEKSGRPQSLRGH